MMTSFSKATYRRPSGFSEPSHYEEEVTILSYVWGKSKDVGRYSDNREECVIAVCIDRHGQLKSIPIANLTIAEPTNDH